jgi:hypothetical protein
MASSRDDAVMMQRDCIRPSALWHAACADPARRSRSRAAGGWRFETAVLWAGRSDYTGLHVARGRYRGSEISDVRYCKQNCKRRGNSTVVVPVSGKVASTSASSLTKVTVPPWAKVPATVTK